MLQLTCCMHIPCDKAIRNMPSFAYHVLCLLGHARTGREAVRAWACCQAPLADRQVCAVVLLRLFCTGSHVSP